MKLQPRSETRQGGRRRDGRKHEVRPHQAATEMRLDEEAEVGRIETVRGKLGRSCNEARQKGGIVWRDVT